MDDDVRRGLLVQPAASPPSLAPWAVSGDLGGQAAIPVNLTLQLSYTLSRGGPTIPAPLARSRFAFARARSLLSASQHRRAGYRLLGAQSVCRIRSTGLNCRQQRAEQGCKDQQGHGHDPDP